VISQIINKLRR